MATRILVVDQATQNVGACIIDASAAKPKWVLATTFKLKGKNAIERIAQLKETLECKINEYNIDTLVLEEVPLQRKTNINTTAVLLKTLGVLEVMGHQLGLSVDIMNVNHWKSVAGITAKNRDGQKAESVQLALKRFPGYADLILDGGKDDLADALNISVAYTIDKKLIKK